MFCVTKLQFKIKKKENYYYYIVIHPIEVNMPKINVQPERSHAKDTSVLTSTVSINSSSSSSSFGSGGNGEAE
jgi:hypothetical protein